MNGRMYYKAGDEVRMRKTGYTGIIAGVIANGRAYWAIFGNDVFGEAPIRCYGNEIEPFETVKVVNPCYYCGAETPEGRQVCGMCERER